MAQLSGLRVVELPGNVGVRFCGHMFVNAGATVTRVRPLDEPAPVLNLDSQSESLFFDDGKASVEVPFTGDVSALEREVLAADVVLASSIPSVLRDSGALDFNGSAKNPALVLGLITEYGFDGPYAEYAGSVLTGFAAGGYLYINGDPHKPPLRGMTHHLYCQTGESAFLAIMAALLERRRSGLGQRVSASVMQTIAPLHEWTSVRYSHGGFVQKRLGNRYAVGYPIRMYRAKESYWCLTVVDQKRTDLLLALAGHAEFVGDPRFETHVGRNENAAELDAMIQPWLLTQTDDELVAQFEAIKLTAAPARDLGQVLADPVFGERDFWRRIPAGEGRVATVPGVPVRSLARTAGGNARKFSEMGATGTGGPLAGLRVIDMTTGWSGPHGLRMLGDLGADVVRVESPWARGTEPPDEAYVKDTSFYPDNEPGERYWMTSGAYNKWNYNKRSVAVRMNTPDGKEVLEGLLRWADVVIDNFSTQAWEKLGVTYDWIKSVNPAVIAVSMPGYGRWGPGKYRVSYGNQIEAYIGADSLMGYEGGEPHMYSIAWPDPVAGMHAAAYALMGIWERDATGEGQFFEVAQAEGGINYMGPAIAKYSLTGEQPPRIGNKDERHAPQGVYPCAGDDRWIAVTVTNDDAWLGFCRVLARDGWAADAGLATAAGRRERHHEIDQGISEWSAGMDRREATSKLQAAGVAAFPVYDAKDMVEDGYLWNTGTFVRVDGEALPGFPYQLSRTPPAVHRGVADVGEHNREALTAAGFSVDDIARLEAAGAIADHPTL